MNRLVVADVGGTRARFAIATISSRARPHLECLRSYATSEHESLISAWARYAQDLCEDLPPALALAIAGSIEAGVVRSRSHRWHVDISALSSALALDRLTVVNDYVAVAHAVSIVPASEAETLMGPKEPLPCDGVSTILGPGTALGVAILDRRAGGNTILATDAAYIGFAPANAEEEALCNSLRNRLGYVPVDAIVSGPGLLNIYNHLTNANWEREREAHVWAMAVEGTDDAAIRALLVLVGCLGAAAGDFALAHGSRGVAFTGALANRMAPQLRSATFAERFVNKGYYRSRMERIPVKLISWSEPGLLGAAVAFHREWYA